MGGDARALLADRLLGNLDQDLLAFLQQVADLRNLLVITTPETAAAATVASSTEITAALKSLALGTLRVSRSCSGSTNLDPGVDRSSFNPLGRYERFGFRLGFLEFGFFFGFVVYLFRSGNVGGFARNRV